MDVFNQNKSRALLATVGLIVISFFCGCVDYETGTGLTPSSLWEAVIGPVSLEPDAPQVRGRAAAVVRSGTSRVGIVIESERIQFDIHWGLFEGLCDGPGDRLLGQDDYPVIEAGEQQLETTLPLGLEATGTYNIRLTTDATTTNVVACGHLVKVEVQEP